MHTLNWMGLFFMLPALFVVGYLLWHWHVALFGPYGRFAQTTGPGRAAMVALYAAGVCGALLLGPALPWPERVVLALTVGGLLGSAAAAFAPARRRMG